MHLTRESEIQNIEIFDNKDTFRILLSVYDGLENIGKRSFI